MSRKFFFENDTNLITNTYQYGRQKQENFTRFYDAWAENPINGSEMKVWLEKLNQTDKRNLIKMTKVQMGIGKRYFKAGYEQLGEGTVKDYGKADIQDVRLKTFFDVMGQVISQNKMVSLKAIGVFKAMDYLKMWEAEEARAAAQQ